MTLWAIIPVKPFREGKSRLARVLQPEERERVNRWLLQHTLNVVAQTSGIAEILVVSRDSAALALARSWGARVYQETGGADLNRALTRTAMLLRQWRVSHMLILAVDLPRLQRADLEALITPLLHRPLPPAGRAVIAPDDERQGTNALGLAPPNNYTFTYGPGSFLRHLRQAQQQGREVHVVQRPGLARDLDWPEDLQLLHHVFPDLVHKAQMASSAAWPG